VTTVVNVCSEIHLDVPCAEVAAYAGNPDNAPRWYQNIDTAEWLSEPPLRTGSQVRFSARFLGRTLTYTYQFVDVVPGKKLVMRTSQGPFPMETTYTWDVDGAGTRMTLRNAGRPRGFSILAGVFMSPMMRRAMRKDLAKLKDILETPASGT
jgi:hypothetical protein